MIGGLSGRSGSSVAGSKVVVGPKVVGGGAAVVVGAAVIAVVGMVVVGAGVVGAGGAFAMQFFPDFVVPPRIVNGPNRSPTCKSTEQDV